MDLFPTLWADEFSDTSTYYGQLMMDVNIILGEKNNSFTEWKYKVLKYNHEYGLLIIW